MTLLKCNENLTLNLDKLESIKIEFDNITDKWELILTLGGIPYCIKTASNKGTLKAIKLGLEQIGTTFTDSILDL